MTRSRAAERRQEREAEKRTSQRRNIIIGIVAAIVILIVLVVLVRLPAEAPIPETAAARYDGITQTRTDSGFPRLGDVDSPVIVRLYSSFGSTQARTFHDLAIDRLAERARSGDIQLIFVPLTQGENANGRGAARAAVCAAEQSSFWALHDALFAWQEAYGNQAFANNRIVAGLAAVGVNQGEYDACLGSSRPDDALDAAETEVAALQGFAGIPTVSINGAVPVDEENIPITEADAVIARIDEAIANAASGAQATPTVEATSEEAAITPTAEPTVEATEAPTSSTPSEDESAAPTIAPTLTRRPLPTETPTPSS
jgi:protein-disulfide isomerase